MLGFVLTVVLDLATGASSKMFDAVDSFENLPRTHAAKQTRNLAFVFLIVGACFGLTAGILFDVSKPSAIDDIFGWTALGCLNICVILGFRYQILNDTSQR